MLSELGINGVRIDRLADRLDLSKGSFYHHFAGIAGYRLALLDHFEARYTSRYIDAVEARGWPTPRAKLDQLIHLVAADSEDPDDIGLETGMRAWAAMDDDARATLERVDRRRTDYLIGLLTDVNPDSADAALLARTLYLTLVGSQHVLPPLPVPELAGIFARLIDVVEQGGIVVEQGGIVPAPTVRSSRQSRP